MFQLRFDTDPHRGCSILIDLSVFPLPPPEARDDLGLTAAQLAFAVQPRLHGATLPGSHTGLYYPHGSLWVAERVVATASEVARLALPYRTVVRAQEDAFAPEYRLSEPLDGYLAQRPRAVVTTLAHRLPLHGELALVHRDHHTGRALAQFKYVNNDADLLLRRAQRLLRHSPQFSVGNHRLREVLRIG